MVERTRRTLLRALAGAGLLARLPNALAQAKQRRIGFLYLGSAADVPSPAAALRAGLRDYGYAEGRNIVIDWRWADGKHAVLPELALELVQRKVELIVTVGTPETLAAKRATAAIPIVMGAVGDALASGIVTSLARPGGNVTGTTIFSGELMSKRLDLLLEALPRARRIAVLINPANPVQAVSWEAMQSAGKSKKLEVHRFEARAESEFESAFRQMAGQGVDALILTQDGIYIRNAAAIAGLAARQKMFAIGFGEFAEAGGVIGYGLDIPETWRRAAYFVHRILQGATVGELPVERPTKFRLVINRKTAASLGFEIPAAMLLRADRVIE